MVGKSVKDKIPADWTSADVGQGNAKEQRFLYTNNRYFPVNGVGFFQQVKTRVKDKVCLVFLPKMH